MQLIEIYFWLERYYARWIACYFFITMLAALGARNAKAGLTDRNGKQNQAKTTSNIENSSPTTIIAKEYKNHYYAGGESS